MISVNDLDKISAFLSSIFYYGFSNGYSSTTIEERLINSKYISSLEKGSSAFLIRETTESLIELVFNVQVNEEDLLQTNPLSLWFGEVYTKLFFSFNKSFSFLFLFLPLSKAEDLFPLYHEMDYSQVVDYFAKMVEKENILTLLLKKKNISVRQLSALTGIKYYTLVGFTRNNENIYDAKFDSIFKISEILEVNINLFAKRINNFSNSEMYLFDKTNIKFRSILALYLVGYYSRTIKDRNYLYDGEQNEFRYKEKIFKMLYTSSSTSSEQSSGKNPEIYSLIDEYSKGIPLSERVSHSLAIFEYNQKSDLVYSYLDLLDYGFENIFIINSRNILCISKQHYISHISETVKNAMINQSKLAVGGDFAI